MIFVTVGMQLPFDRLVNKVDEWAGENKVKDIFAQIGSTSELPNNIESAPYLNPDEAEKMFQKSTVIVSHAGMGSVLNAMKYKKPLIAMPRLASKGEHRNDHQLATAKWIGAIDGISVAWDEGELFAMLAKVKTLEPGPTISDYASSELIENLQKFFSN
ncbi:MAG: glycosyltransferase [Methylophilaceae bacterium]